MPAWVLHFDGLYEPRQVDRGIATYGYALRHGDELIGTGHGLLVGPGEGGSANVAEFGALAHGLAYVEEHKHDECPLHIRGDSRLVIETVAGRWDLTSEHLIPLHDHARATLARIPGEVTLQKVTRDENAEADALSRKAYHEAADANPAWGLGRHAKSARRRR